MDEESKNQETKNPILQRLYEKSRTSLLVKILLWIMILDEIAMAIALVYIAFF